MMRWMESTSTTSAENDQDEVAIGDKYLEESLCFSYSHI